MTLIGFFINDRQQAVFIENRTKGIVKIRVQAKSATGYARNKNKF